MLFFQENKEIPNKNTEEYCQKLEELLNFYNQPKTKFSLDSKREEDFSYLTHSKYFYNQTKTKFSLDPKREEAFSNLNLTYSKYFEFQIIKEYYSSCKK